MRFYLINVRKNNIRIFRKKFIFRLYNIFFTVHPEWYEKEAGLIVMSFVLVNYCEMPLFRAQSFRQLIQHHCACGTGTKN